MADKPTENVAQKEQATQNENEDDFDKLLDGCTQQLDQKLTIQDNEEKKHNTV